MAAPTLCLLGRRVLGRRVLGRRVLGAKAPLTLPTYISLRDASCASTGCVRFAADTYKPKKSSKSANDSRAQNKSISTLLNVFRPERVLVTGSLGQVGRELVPALQSVYGIDNVVATDARAPSGLVLAEENVNFRRLDVLDHTQLQQVCEEEDISTVVHLAAILSAKGEKNPLLALKINNGR